MQKFHQSRPPVMNLHQSILKTETYPFDSESPTPPNGCQWTDRPTDRTSSLLLGTQGRGSRRGTGDKTWYGENVVHDGVVEIRTQGVLRDCGGVLRGTRWIVEGQNRLSVWFYVVSSLF